MRSSVVQPGESDKIERRQWRSRHASSGSTPLHACSRMHTRCMVAITHYFQRELTCTNRKRSVSALYHMSPLSSCDPKNREAWTLISRCDESYGCKPGCTMFLRRISCSSEKSWKNSDKQYAHNVRWSRMISGSSDPKSSAIHQKWKYFTIGTIPCIRSQEM